MDKQKWEPIQEAKKALFGNNGALHLWEAWARTLNGLSSRELIEVVVDVSPLCHHPLKGLVDVALAKLQAQLTLEHVAAQERMSAAAEALQQASLVLGNASVNLGIESSRLSNRMYWQNWLIAGLTAATLLHDVFH